MDETIHDGLHLCAHNEPADDCTLCERAVRFTKLPHEEGCECAVCEHNTFQVTAE